MAKKSRKKHVALKISLALIAVAIAAGAVFSRFGGFGTGPSADPEEFAKYAGAVEDIKVPDQACVIALGEATHGNKEFQELKLSVFQHMVEDYGVRAFVLEGDYGGCEAVDRYIHGGEGTADEAVAEIDFAIYRTDEMAALAEWMREYNATAAPGDDLRFYGIDCQRTANSARYLLEDMRSLELDTSQLEGLFDNGEWRESMSFADREAILESIQEELEGMSDAERSQTVRRAIHLIATLSQNLSLEQAYENDPNSYGQVRGQYMAQNTEWTLEQERNRGNNRIFLSAHNGHIGKADSSGAILHDTFGDGYYAIGTDFFKTDCNLPDGNDGRTVQTFYSYDPLAKAAKTAGLDCTWLDFSVVPQNSSLRGYIDDAVSTGTLGEQPMDLVTTVVMRLQPAAYRLHSAPIDLYDGMIFVPEASPTDIHDQSH